MPELDFWRVLTALGVPGVALGVFLVLFRAFKWKLPTVPRLWVGPLLLVFMLLVSGVVFFALGRFAPSPTESPAVEPSVLSAIKYKNEILDLRGNFEALEQYPKTADAIVQDGARLGALMANLSDGKLDLARRILKYQYGGWAYLIAARVSDNNRDRETYIANSISMLERALQQISVVKRLHAQGDSSEAQNVYEWLTSPGSDDLNRTRYLLAVAFAVDSRHGGEHGVGDVQSQISAIDSWYLDIFSISHNPDLAWICSANMEHCQ